MTDSNTTVAANETLNTSLLMKSSAVVLGLLGLGMSFYPGLILSQMGVELQDGLEVLLGGLAAAYLAFAVLNWMAREKLIGGIYSRPVAVGNFAHFLGASIVVLKYLPAAETTVPVAVVAGVFALFATAFGYVVFGTGGSCA